MVISNLGGQNRGMDEKKKTPQAHELEERIRQGLKKVLRRLQRVKRKEESVGEMLVKSIITRLGSFIEKREKEE